MKTVSNRLKRHSILLLLMGMTFMMLTNCAKEGDDKSCDNCDVRPLYQLVVDFPPVQTPGCLTLMKATVLGEIAYPITISWYASKDLYPQSLQQIDTLTSGNKAWFSFMFPSLYKASAYNKGPYNIRCVANKIMSANVEMLIEKTVSIKTAQ
ncbi:MAG: hypothetical protein ABI761_14735 [Saprospiraceae bacterium]